MAQYIINVQATAAAAGTENSFISLTASSSNIIDIIRVRVSSQTAAGIEACRVRLLRCATVGSTPSSATAIRKDPISAASETTVNVKNGATAWTTPSVTDVLDDMSFNSRGMFEWQAIDDDDTIAIANSVFHVTVNNSTTASQLICVTVEWQEQR